MWGSRTDLTQDIPARSITLRQAGLRTAGSAATRSAPGEHRNSVRTRSDTNAVPSPRPVNARSAIARWRPRSCRLQGWKAATSECSGR